MPFLALIHPNIPIRSAASTVLSAIYAWPPIDKSDDALVDRINDLMHRLVSAALPGAFLVEIFPVMKRLPSWMAKWKREGLEWHRKDTEMFQGFMDGVRKTMVRPYPPFYAANIKSRHRTGFWGI
jgi:hypothetical protein